MVAQSLAAWTLFFQGYIYTEPVTGVAWRGPAAGSAVMAVLLLWVLLDYHSPGAYRPLHEFETTQDGKPFRPHEKVQIRRDAGESSGRAA